jgi:hypothetical protein
MYLKFILDAKQESVQSDRGIFAETIERIGMVD